MRKAVTITVLVSIEVDASSDAAAKDTATRLLDGMLEGADQFIAGWNQEPDAPQVIDVSHDVEGDIEVNDC